MGTKRTKQYFFTGVQGTSGKKLKKGNKPDQSTYEDILASTAFLLEPTDTATETTQGLVSQTTDLEFAKGTNTDGSGFALTAKPSQVKALILDLLTHATSSTEGLVQLAESADITAGTDLDGVKPLVVIPSQLKTTNDLVEALMIATNQFIIYTGVPNFGVTVNTYSLDANTGNIWYSEGGISGVWSLKYTNPVNTSFTVGENVPTGIGVSIPTYYLDSNTGNIYFNNAIDQVWILAYKDTKDSWITSTAMPTTAVFIPTYCLVTNTGNVYYNVGGGSRTWTLKYAAPYGLIYGTTVPVSTVTRPTYYLMTANGSFYYNTGTTPFNVWTRVYAPFGMLNLPVAVFNTLMMLTSVYNIDPDTGIIYYKVFGGSKVVFYDPKVNFATTTETDDYIRTLDVTIPSSYLLLQPEHLGLPVIYELFLLDLGVSTTQFIELIDIVAMMDYGTAPYASGTGANNTMEIFFHDSTAATNTNSSAAICTIPKTFLLSTADALMKLAIDPTFISIYPGYSLYIANIEAGNKALTTGDGDLKLKILYRTVDFA